MADAPPNITPSASASIVKLFRGFSWWASLAVITIGIVVLLGWALDSDVLTSVIPGRVTQKPNTAIGLLAGGTALALWHRQANAPTGNSRRWRRALLYGAVGIVMVVGIETLIEYGFDLNFGVDELLFEMPPDAPDTLARGRPAPNTAINFVLMGSALLLLTQRRYRAAQGLSIVAFFIALGALTGHLYAISALYWVGAVTGMAIHTALGFLLLSTGVLFAQADAGWMREASSDYDGSRMMRRLLPVVLVLPVAMGMLTLAIYTNFALYPEAAIALRSVISIVLFSVIVWWNGRALNRLEARRLEVQQRFNRELEAEVAARTADLNATNLKLQQEIERREQAQTELQASRQLLQRQLAEIETIYHSAPIGLNVLDRDLRFVRINERLAEMNGFSVEEHIGRSVRELLPNLADAAEQLLQPIVETGQPLMDVEIEGETPAQPGVKRVWRESFLPLKDGDRVVGISTVCEEITERKRMQAALKQSERRYRRLFETMEDGFCVVEVLHNDAGRPINHRFIEVNPAFERQTGMREATGRTALDIVPGLEPFWFEIYGKVAESGIPARFESGSIAMNRWFDVHAFRVMVSDRPRVAILFREISERKRAEAMLMQRAAQQAEVAGIGQQALACDDIDGFLDRVTTRVAQVLDVEYCKVLELLPDGSGLLMRSGVGWQEGLVGRAVVPSDVGSQAGYTLQSHGPVVVEDLNTETRFTGPALLTEHDVVSGMSTLIGGIGDRAYGVLGVHTRAHRRFSENDVNFLQAIANILSETITRHQNEQEIRQINATLEGRIEERTQQLVEINEELEAFAYSVSHDLRAPLRAIEGLARIFQEDYADRLDETGQDYTQMMIDSSVQLDNLIRDLLAYGQLGRRDIDLGPVYLKVVVDNALQDLATEFEERQPDVVVEPLPVAIAQRTVLRQVMVNLLSNAVKFVEPDKTPVVRIWAEGQGRWVRVWVEDNGIGISPHHQERIFRPFERLHGVEAYSGTGIGLAIVQRGIKRMGGRVGLESTAGKGSRFWFELPRADVGAL